MSFMHLIKHLHKLCPETIDHFIDAYVFAHLNLPLAVLYSVSSFQLFSNRVLGGLVLYKQSFLVLKLLHNLGEPWNSEYMLRLLDTSNFFDWTEYFLWNMAIFIQNEYFLLQFWLAHSAPLSWINTHTANPGMKGLL